MIQTLQEYSVWVLIIALLFDGLASFKLVMAKKELVAVRKEHAKLIKLYTKYIKEDLDCESYPDDRRHRS